MTYSNNLEIGVSMKIVSIILGAKMKQKRREIKATIIQYNNKASKMA
jgi:hypothetical protein